MLLSLLKVKGHSMEPAMKDGSFFIASSLPFLIGKPKKEDIIVFEVQGETIVKKIIKIENDKYYIEGENKADSLGFLPITKNEILGKLIFKF